MSSGEIPNSNPVFQETKEEREKRIRKEASKRMQQKFRERLHARTSEMIEQINSKPQKTLQENTNSTPLSQIPQATQATTVNNRTATLEARANNQPPNIQHQELHHEHAGTERMNDRSYVDWLIAVIIIAIAALLYRRAVAFLNFLPGPVSNTDGGHDDQSGSELLHNLDDM